MTRRILLPIAAVCAIALLGVSGCGTSKPHETAGKNLSPPTATTTTTATTAALPGSDKPTVTIGDKNFTEQFVLGELYKQALAAKGYTTLINRNIGPTEVTIQALQSGRLSMYPEYIGTWDAAVAGDPQQFRTARAAYDAGRQYAQAHGLELLHPTPFSDVDGIAVALQYAQQNGLQSIGDLAKAAPMLTLGAPAQFKTSQMGLVGLGQTYGVFPAAFKQLEFGDQYPALDQGTVQAADVMTTDAQLLSGQYALLRDPKRLFGWGNVVPVVPSKVLAAEGPEFASTIDAVSALLTTDTMRTLNARVDVYHQDPAAVAKQFLQLHGLVPAGAP